MGEELSTTFGLGYGPWGGSSRSSESRNAVATFLDDKHFVYFSVLFKFSAHINMYYLLSQQGPLTPCLIEKGSAFLGNILWQIDHRHLNKEDPEIGMLVVKVLHATVP